ncbi:MAG: hypothetical protein CMK59_11290 [Proteobacteria bacterium]|nr:hypothetical protein [Pseudomonadota bacterium]
MLYLFACLANSQDSAVITEQKEQLEDWEDLGERYILYTTIRQSGTGTVNIFDRQSQEVLWTYFNERGHQWVDVQASVAGDRLYVLEEDLFDSNGHGTWLLTLDRNGILSERELPNGHHTIAVREHEGVEQIYTIHNKFIQSDPPLISDVVQLHIGQSSTTFFDLEDWIVWDKATPFFMQLESGMIDKTHVNTLRYDQDRGTLILSCAGINTIIEMDLSGQIVAAYLGSQMEAEAFSESPNYTGYPIFSGAVYDKPHGGLFDEEGVLWSITDIETETGELRKSVMGYRPEDGVLYLNRQIDPPYEGMLPMAGGDVIPVGGQRIVVSWGFSGIVEEVDSEGERVWMIEMPFQEGAGFLGSMNDVSLFLE